MALADPQVITIDGTANSLARTFIKNDAGTFVTADGTYTLEVVPKNGNSKVRTVRLRNSKITSDPLVSSTNVRVTDLISLTVIRPNDGYSDAEVVKQVAGFLNWLTASSNTNLIKVIAGEN